MKYTIISLLIILSCLMIGCSGMTKEFSYMGKLEDTLSKNLKTKNIGINITNGEFIAVTLVNTQYNKSTREQKDKLARRIGSIVKSTCNDSFEFKDGIVQFVNQHNYVILHTNTSEAYNMKLGFPLKHHLN